MFALRDQNKKKREHEDQHIRTKMQEIGPRLTLKLRWLKRGTLADDEKDSGLPAGKGFKGDAKGKGKEDGAAEDVEVDYTGGRGEQADEDEGDDDAKAEAEALHEAGLSNDIEPTVEGGTEDPTGIASDQGVPQPPPDDGKAPPSKPTKKKSKKRKRKTEEDEPQWETEPVAPEKKAAEKSVLDQSSALMRGRSGKESWEWVWKVRSQETCCIWSSSPLTNPVHRLATCDPGLCFLLVAAEDAGISSAVLSINFVDFREPAFRTQCGAGGLCFRRGIKGLGGSSYSVHAVIMAPM